MEKKCPECNHALNDYNECTYCRIYNGNNKYIFIYSLIILCVVGILFFPAINSSSKYKFLERFSANEVYEVSQTPTEHTFFKEEKETLSLEQIVVLSDMLVAKRFEELNAALEGFQKKFNEDQTNEYLVYDAYQTFDLTEPVYENYLEAWADAFPANYQPHLAIARYYYSMGWESRGYKWAKDTSEEQFEQMRFYLSKSEEYINKALVINPDLMPGYDLLIRIYNSRGDSEAEGQTIKKAVELFPDSFLLRKTSVWTKEPRWGGSYESMETVAREALSFSEANPAFIKLYGFIYTDQGRKFRRGKKYDKASELFSKALRFGEHWSFYYERAMNYYYMEDHDKALHDINDSIRLRPAVCDLYIFRSKIFFAMEEYQESINDINNAELLKSRALKTKKWKTRSSKKLKKIGHELYKTDLPGAIEKYTTAIEFNPRNGKAFYWRGKAFSRLKDFDSALSDFEKSIEIDPHHFKSYQKRDYILARSRQWAAIISYWDRFLDLEPDHAEAYFERAGTHYHNGDMGRALKDLETSCALGNKKACERRSILSAGSFQKSEGKWKKR